MRHSLSTACLFPWPWPSIFRLAAECGFDGVELVIDHHFWLGGADRVRRWATEYGLEIFSVHQTYLPLCPSGPNPAIIVDAARAALKLNCHRVVIHGPFVSSWREPMARRWLRSFDQAQRILLGSSSRLALENVGVYTPSDGQNVLAQTLVLCSFARRNKVGLTLDVCHLGIEENLLAAYEAMRNQLINIHFSDQRHAGKQQNRYERALTTHHLMPGEGQLLLEPFVARLYADAYNEPLTYEISPAALGAWCLYRTKKRLRQAITWVRSCESADVSVTNRSIR